jgi:hypothetical protein
LHGRTPFKAVETRQEKDSNNKQRPLKKTKKKTELIHLEKPKVLS